MPPIKIEKLSELQFTSDWLRRRGEVIALTGQWTGLGLHFVTFLLAPFIGNQHNLYQMYWVFGSFFVAGLIFNSVVNWLGKGVRLNFLFFSIAYCAAIAWFLHLGTELSGTEFVNEMLVSSGAYIVVMVILLLLCPFHQPAVVLGIAALYFGFGSYAINGTEFASRWQVICGLAAGFAASWHIIETRKSLISARDFYKQSRLLAEAEKATAEAYAREGQTRVQTMVATTQMLAHDLRNPLALFKSFLGLIQNTEGDDSAALLVHRFEGEMNRSLESMDSMINDVMEAGSTPLITWSDFQLQQIVADSLRAVFHDKIRATIQFNYNLNLESMIRGDRIKIQRVVTNIIKNASEAMKDTGVITISATPTVVNGVKLASFRIHNSGTYIAAEHQERIFEAFFTAGKKKGTGLGLAIAKRFLEAHGGNITCTSDKIDGTAFTLTMPLSEVLISEKIQLPNNSKEITSNWITSDSTKETNEASQALIDKLLNVGRPMYILVVDDEALYTKLIRNMLAPIRKDLKIKIEAASNIDEALRLSEHNKFDLIICDVDLDDESGNGYSLIEELRTRGCEAYICMHSNRMLPGDQARSVKAGADASIPKPIAKAQLLQLLHAKALTDQKAA